MVNLSADEAAWHWIVRANVIRVIAKITKEVMADLIVRLINLTLSLFDIVVNVLNKNKTDTLGEM